MCAVKAMGDVEVLWSRIGHLAPPQVTFLLLGVTFTGSSRMSVHFIPHRRSKPLSANRIAFIGSTRGNGSKVTM
jgi:hypothetical protein